MRTNLQNFDSMFEGTFRKNRSNKKNYPVDYPVEKLEKIVNIHKNLMIVNLNKNLIIEKLKNNQQK
jgi:hypothetical protein